MLNPNGHNNEYLPSHFNIGFCSSAKKLDRKISQSVKAYFIQSLAVQEKNMHEAIQISQASKHLN